MKKKIGALLLTVAMAVALLAGPALARDNVTTPTTIDGAVAMSGANIIPTRATDIVRGRLGPTRNRATATTTIGVGRGKIITDGEAITTDGVITTAIATK
jgi:hypothetical protein